MPEEYDDPGWITDPHDEEPDPGAEDPEAYYHDTHDVKEVKIIGASNDESN